MVSLLGGPGSGIAVQWRDSGRDFACDAGKGSSLELWAGVVRGWVSKLGQSYVRDPARRTRDCWFLSQRMLVLQPWWLGISDFYARKSWYCELLVDHSWNAADGR